MSSNIGLCRFGLDRNEPDSYPPTKTKSLYFEAKSGISTGSMDMDIIIGCILAAAALIIVTGLALWSRRTIDRIANNGYRTARQTLKELNSDK